MIVNVRSLMRPSYPTGTRDTGSVGGVTIINIDVIVIFMHHYIVVTVRDRQVTEPACIGPSWKTLHAVRLTLTPTKQGVLCSQTARTGPGELAAFVLALNNPVLHACIHTPREHNIVKLPEVV